MQIFFSSHRAKERWRELKVVDRMCDAFVLYLGSNRAIKALTTLTVILEISMTYMTVLGAFCTASHGKVFVDRTLND